MIIRKSLQPVEIKTKWYNSGKHMIWKEGPSSSKSFYATINEFPSGWSSSDYNRINAALLKVDVSPLAPLAGIPMKRNKISCRWDPKAAGLKKEMSALMLNGNVKLTNRPKVSKASMIAAGYTDFDGDYATLYSMTYIIVNTVQGQQTTIGTLLLTPIKSDGTVLGPQQIDAYFDEHFGSFIKFALSKLQSNDSDGLLIHALPGEQIDKMEEIAVKAHELSDAWETKSVRVSPSSSVLINISTGLEAIEGQVIDFKSVIRQNGTYQFIISQQVDYADRGESQVDPDIKYQLLEISKRSLYPAGSTLDNDQLKNANALYRIYESMPGGETKQIVCSSTTTFYNMELLIYTDNDVPVYEDGKLVVGVKNDGVTSDLICLYDYGEKEFKGNGLAVLHPSSCVVSETAGSDYSLSLEYPLADDRWKLIKPGRLICAPVPPTSTPQFELADVTFWRVKSARQAKVYAKPCVSYASGKKSSGSNANLLTTGSDGVNGNHLPTDIQTNNDPNAYHVDYTYTTPGGETVTVKPWNELSTYYSGSYVEYNGSVYQLSTDLLQFPDHNPPPDQSFVWKKKAPAGHVYDTTTHIPEGKKEDKTQYVATTVYCTLPAGWVVMVISVVNTYWVYIKTTYHGKQYMGYVQAEFLTEETVQYDDEDRIVEPRNITKQAFRITNVSVDTSNHTLTASAMHKSYDLQKTMLSGCELENVSPTLAIAVVQSSEMAVHDKRLILTDIGSDRDDMYDHKNNISGDWGWDNALAAFMDDDNGIVAQLKARLVRDNDDIFILRNKVSDAPAFSFSARSNLVGVNWTIDESEVVTRVIPKGEDKSGNPYLIDGFYVDATNANDFSEYRCEVLDTGYKIGEYTIIEGQSVLLDPDAPKNEAPQYYARKAKAVSQLTGVTRASISDLMKGKAQERYDLNHANLVKHTVEVDFTMLGDTLEYSALKALGEARLYDTVRVMIPEMGMDIVTQVNGYEWDCTNPHRPFMKSLVLSDTYKENNWPVSGMRIQNGSIKLNKLARTAREEFYRYANNVGTKIMAQTVKQLKSYADNTFERKTSGGGSGLVNEDPASEHMYASYQIDDADIPAVEEPEEDHGTIEED